VLLPNLHGGSTSGLFGKKQTTPFLHCFVTALSKLLLSFFLYLEAGGLECTFKKGALGVMRRFYSLPLVFLI